MASSTLVKDKLIAAAAHFVFSAILMAIAGFVIFRIWYLSPFSQLFAIANVFGLLLAVDLVLGPLCTFIVYKKGKKTLKMDLVVILLIQLAAFGWGIWQMAEARPAWLVLKKDALFAVSPVMLKDKQDNAALMPLAQQNWGKPLPITLKVQDGTPQKVPDIVQPDNFTALSTDVMLKNSLTLDKIKAYDNDFYTMILQHHPDTTTYLPIITEASTQIAIALLDKNGTILDYYLPPEKTKPKIP